MPEAESSSKDSYSGPKLWIRLLSYFGPCWISGLIDLLNGPGGTVQTLGSQLAYILFAFPIYVPGFVAFAAGGILHSAIVFFLALIVFYIGAVVHIFMFFTTKSQERWYFMLAILIGALLLALLGSTIFVHNLQAWT